MYSKKNHLSVFFFLFLFTAVIAQPRISVGLGEFPSVLNNTDSYNFTIWVKNTGTAALPASKMEAKYAIRGTPGAAYTLTLFSTSVPLNPGDSVSVSVNGFKATNPPFQAGENIVVVWPTGAGNMIADSTEKKVYYAIDTRVFSAGKQLRGDVVPVPANTVLFMTGDLRFTKKEVQICDYLGRELFRLKDVSEQINIEFLKDGIYFLHIRAEGFAPLLKMIVKSCP